MKRKLIVFCLLLLSVALLLTACGPNNAERYEEAKKLLYNRQYAEAVKAFEELKGYEDSSKYATYAKLLDFGDQGQYDDAISGLRSMGDFADATLEAIYYTARKQESVEAYEEATDSYTRVITFRDSMARRSALPDKILDRDFRNASAALKAESCTAISSRWHRKPTATRRRRCLRRSPGLRRKCRTPGAMRTPMPCWASCSARAMRKRPACIWTPSSRKRMTG